MIRIRVFVSALIAATLLCAAVAQAQEPSVNATGTWRLTGSGEPFTTGALRIEQTGATLAGSYGTSGQINGSFKPGTLQLDGTWSDNRGNGWLTLRFDPSGNGFSGEWGYPSTKPAGSFVGSRIVATSFAGHYTITVSGSQEFPPARRMTLHQLGQNVVGNFGPYTQLTGTLTTDPNTVMGSWKAPTGEGWIRLHFALDRKSFQGEWGLRSDTDARGHIEGTSGHMPAAMHVVTSAYQISAQGLWDTATSSTQFAFGRLRLQQRGVVIDGSYNGGHVHGTLPRDSHTLTLRWKGSNGSGY
ncbi:MAG: hypothetical protein JO060_12035, partial [Candidatus Eremiobacteraeota bacterium]|nr:hypothetical protein [Candidatus Eremiobacteraeota bacterium]